MKQLKNKLFSVIAACVLIICTAAPCPPASAENDAPACLHEAAQWRLSRPASLILNAEYEKTCPDCGFSQTSKQARSAEIYKAFDRFVGLLFPAPAKELSENFTVTAHTGPGEIPQNSPFSLKYCLNSGADIVEFDLDVDSRGTAVLAHADPDEAKMTLDEAFALVSEYYGVMVNVDVKNVAAVGMCRESALKYGMTDRIFYTGLSADSIPAIKENSPGIDYYINYYPNPPENDRKAYYDAFTSRASELGAIGINTSFGNLTPELSQSAREHGLLISVWTVNKTADMYDMLAADLDNITTEFPYKLCEITG